MGTEVPPCEYGPNVPIPPGCEGFDTGGGGWNYWVGMSEGDNAGQLLLCGCDVRCKYCHEGGLWESPDNDEAKLDGRRWASASRTRYSRFADGRVGPMRSRTKDDPHVVRLPYHTYFDRAPCYADSIAGADSSYECYDNGLCDCDHSPDCLIRPGPPYGPCNELEPVGLCPGMHQDKVWFTGYGLIPPAVATWMYCRRTVDFGRLTIPMSAGRLYQDSFLRAGMPCIGNRFVPCAAWVPDTTGCLSRFDPLPPQTQYNPWASPMWNYMGVTYHNVRIRDESGINPMVADIKTATLNEATSRLGTLRYACNTAGNASGNDDIDLWHEDWASGPDCSGALVWTLPNAILRYSRVPVEVDLVMVRARAAISLVASPWRFDATDVPSERFSELYGHARFRVWAQLRAVIHIPGGEGVPIVRPGVCREWEYPVNDEIIYYDYDGKPFQPPNFVEWWGYYGHSGKNGQPNLMTERDWGTGVNSHRCCRLGKYVSGMKIYGWPTHADSYPDDHQRVYGGHVEIDFLNQGTFQSQCAQVLGGVAGGTSATEPATITRTPTKFSGSTLPAAASSAIPPRAGRVPVGRR